MPAYESRDWLPGASHCTPLGPEITTIPNQLQVLCQAFALAARRSFVDLLNTSSELFTGFSLMSACCIFFNVLFSSQGE